MRVSVENMERLLQARVVRTGVSLAAHAAATGAGLFKRSRFLELSWLLRGWRALEHVPPGDVPRRLLARAKRAISVLDDETERRRYHEKFQATARASRIRAQFASYDVGDRLRLRLPRNDGDETREGDLIILKPPQDGGEKGVILIKYSPSFATFAAVYELESLSSLYRFVLEPSTWGYQDPDLLLYLNLPTEVIVQAQYGPDFEFIRSLGRNLIPIETGAGDWVNPDEFWSSRAQEKQFDLVMVASWLRLKRHYLLFRSLRRLGGRVRRVALVGMPFDGRTLQDVKAEARSEGVLDKITWFESLPHSQVAEVLRQSRVSMMLSTREGASKILYESLFCDVPVVISECNVGVNRRHINPRTGIVSSDEDLAEAISNVLDNPDQFEPRAWALEHTGYIHSTCAVQEALKGAAVSRAEPWTMDIMPKVNASNPRYLTREQWSAAQPWYKDLMGFLR